MPTGAHLRPAILYVLIIRRGRAAPIRRNFSSHMGRRYVRTRLTDHVSRATPASRFYRFGDFCFDTLRGVLLRGSDIIPVSERLALILTQLIQANGRVLSKEALALSVWPDEAVSDANLVQHIYMLRRIFGERAKDHSLIIAVPRQGYRLAVPVEIVQTELNETFSTTAASLGEIVSGADFEAFRAYCQGSFFLEQRTAPAIGHAMELFETSLKSNPDYLPALIGLARSYCLWGTYWHKAPDLTFPFAACAIDKALSIDPSNPVAHAVRCGILDFWKWDWEAAQQEIDLAIGSNPGSTLVRNNAAWHYICIGRYEAALVQAQLALALEPSSLLRQLLVARVLLHMGKHPQAVAIMSNILENDGGFYVARRYRAHALLLGGHPEKAVDDLQHLSFEEDEDPSFRLPALGRAYADLGDERRAIEIFGALEKLSRRNYVACWNLAIVATGLGRFDEALTYLETACARREATMPFLKSLRWFEPISGTPRFQALLERVDGATPSPNAREARNERRAPAIKAQ